MNDDAAKLGLVKRVFGGEYTEDFKTEVETDLSARDFKNMSPEAWERWVKCTESSKKSIVRRAQRLSRQGWQTDVAVELAVGVLPPKKERWPAKQRYALAGGATREDINRELYDWFMRNHEMEN